MLGCKSRKETAHSQAWALCYFRRPAGAHNKLTNKEKVEDTLPKKNKHRLHVNTHFWRRSKMAMRWHNEKVR